MLLPTPGSKRLVVAVTFVFALACLFIWSGNGEWRSSTAKFTQTVFHGSLDASQEGRLRSHPSSHRPTKTPATETAKEEESGMRQIGWDMSSSHTVLKSLSTKDGQYFFVDFGQEAINPNIIPHRSLNDTWIIVAQQGRSLINKSIWSAELTCNAAFDNGDLRCIDPPLLLPVGATFGNKCAPKLDFFRWNVGPHDARVFWGPDKPYIVFGSVSQITCFGMWLQDFRVLVDWGFVGIKDDRRYRQAVELQRPPPYRQVEKNFFIFWDKIGQVYVHYEVAPHRAFARLEADGSVGPDLALETNSDDEKCMAKFMPEIAPELESIHQATNSLLITTCKRSDPNCIPSDKNTFVMTIFQHKSFYSFHSVYDPYVMLFKQTAPFGIHAISTKALWISGRGYARKPNIYDDLSPEDRKKKLDEYEQSEMFYVTSFSWKERGVKYHGYADDVLFLAFGIEDLRTGGIDVLAGDLLQNLGFCADAGVVGDEPEW